MNFTKLVPNIFYENIQDGIELFVDCLTFTMGYSNLTSVYPCCIVEKDNLQVFLHQNKEYAVKDRPEIRLHTNNIEEVFEEVARTHKKFLHPNLKGVTMKPWGAKEFALLDATNVCVIIQQW